MNLVDEAVQKTLDRQVATEALRQSVPHHDPGLEALQRAHQAIETSRQRSQAIYGEPGAQREPAPQSWQPPEWDRRFILFRHEVSCTWLVKIIVETFGIQFVKDALAYIGAIK